MPLEFSSEVKARIEAIAARYPRRGAALLPVLHFVQHEYGYLSHEVQAAVAQALDVPPTLVREVTTFYEMYHEHPEGQFHLEMCTNIACHLQGADAVMAHLKKTLQIEVGHQTEDGMFSLMEAECLASCGSGPALRCGSDYYEYLTVPAIDALLKRFRDTAPSLNGKHYEEGPGGPHTGPVPGFDAPRPSPTRPRSVGEVPPKTGDGPVTPTNSEPAVASPKPIGSVVPAPVDAPAPPPTGAAAPNKVEGAVPNPAPSAEPAKPAAEIPNASAPPAGDKNAPGLPAFEPPPLKRKGANGEEGPEKGAEASPNAESKDRKDA